jgi:hypothetical protein
VPVLINVPRFIPEVAAMKPAVGAMTSAGSHTIAMFREPETPPFKAHFKPVASVSILQAQSAGES